MTYRVGAAVAALSLALVAVLLWWAREPSVAVAVAEARAGVLSLLVGTNGVVEPMETAEVRARLDGRVVEVPEAGSEVSAGELLLEIESGPTAAELAAAESRRLAALDSLREAEDKLRRTLRRVEHDRGLFRDQALTQERLDESLADLREVEARVTFLQSEVPLRVASLDLRITELRAQRDGAQVRAAFDGVVYKTAAKRGQRVRSGDAIVWFADLKRLRVRVNVDQVDLGRVQLGQRVRITSNAYPGRAWSARIEQLIPNVVKKESRFVAEALAQVEPPVAGLVPGMSVDIEVAIEAVSDALQIPSEAIFADERGSFVYRVAEDRVHRTRVEVGRSTVDAIEIVAGLEAGARIVTPGASARALLAQSCPPPRALS